jgi:hypothetical protein
MSDLYLTAAAWQQISNLIDIAERAAAETNDSEYRKWLQDQISRSKALLSVRSGLATIG